MKNVLVWIRNKINHKLQHLEKKKMIEIIKRDGVALVVIIVLWEIIEDIIFPVSFGVLGKYVHPIFYAGIPVSWVLCLHWFVVPIAWGIWCKFRGKNRKEKHLTCDHH